MAGGVGAVTKSIKRLNIKAENQIRSRPFALFLCLPFWLFRWGFQHFRRFHMDGDICGRDDGMDGFLDHLGGSVRLVQGAVAIHCDVHVNECMCAGRADADGGSFVSGRVDISKNPGSVGNKASALPVGWRYLKRKRSGKKNESRCTWDLLSLRNVSGFNYQSGFYRTSTSTARITSLLSYSPVA